MPSCLTACSLKQETGMKGENLQLHRKKGPNSLSLFHRTHTVPDRGICSSAGAHCRQTHCPSSSTALFVQAPQFQSNLSTLKTDLLGEENAVTYAGRETSSTQVIHIALETLKSPHFRGWLSFCPSYLGLMFWLLRQAKDLLFLLALKGTQKVF